MCTAAETMCMAFIGDGHDAILDCYDPKVNYIVTCTEQENARETKTFRAFGKNYILYISVSVYLFVPGKEVIHIGPQTFEKKKYSFM